ncbi:DUF3710 domain-containing protein [Frankia sp. CNm7]|uniref:DUF3710 domain-containing protein n=1 Tax=Frankia nepalensis TaxID=1836974 RepID=A0A937RQ06_9ACTN|nr:DUF3710 domain-containing protein [Frankia nepalensis]MBL7495169.1 DUF3710 domain-containing protein [Frankia nepalensis]MBL7514211.1 DUF3710 domain-containing protein [Frankia nepalensis]MBL7520011.1 DUF3710 domain-containing protein [Frankia nepalensis]MBL7629876.1 DUF3710 domain-containing protein [Frankia nepalensis]
MAFGRRRRQQDDEDALLDEEREPDEDVDDSIDFTGEPEGPYDVSEAPRDGVHRLDIGGLRVPALEGVQIQFQVEEASGRPLSVVVADGQSAMELAVFAAPKSRGLWGDVRAEIVEQLQAAGGTPRTVEGPHGRELELALPTPVPGQMVPGRMIGVDGPRWFVRAVLTGPGALDPTRAPLLVETLRRLVVVRGDDAMPVRDPLPLKLPKEVTDNVPGSAGGDAPAGTGTSATSGRPQMPTPGARIAELR